MTAAVHRVTGRVVAVAAVQDVVAGAAVQGVVVDTAEHIVAGPAVQRVIAGAAVEDVGIAVDRPYGKGVRAVGQWADRLRRAATRERPAIDAALEGRTTLGRREREGRRVVGRIRRARGQVGVGRGRVDREAALCRRRIV